MYITILAKLVVDLYCFLFFSRRERHAKTLEIAQEEVLTCLGICVYERLHRIYIRMREEECTCQVYAAVAVDSLCRSFETAVEKKQGISQLELLYEELTKEEQLKQQRKEQKKLKRKRKKEKLVDEKENCIRCETPIEEESKCLCSMNIISNIKLDKSKDLTVNCKDCHDNKKNAGTPIKDKCLEQNIEKARSKDNWYETEGNCNCAISDTSRNTKKKNKICSFTQNSAFDEHDDSDLSDPIRSKNIEKHVNKEFWSSSEHSHDCGYSSENNNGCCETTSGASSLPSSPEGSEMACSESCCNLAVACHAEYKHSKFFPRGSSIKLSLQQMLEVKAKYHFIHSIIKFFAFKICPF